MTACESCRRHGSRGALHRDFSFIQDQNPERNLPSPKVAIANKQTFSRCKPQQVIPLYLRNSSSFTRENLVMPRRCCSIGRRLVNRFCKRHYSIALMEIMNLFYCNGNVVRDGQCEFMIFFPYVFVVDEYKERSHQKVVTIIGISVCIWLKHSRNGAHGWIAFLLLFPCVFDTLGDTFIMTVDQIKVRWNSWLTNSFGSLFLSVCVSRKRIDWLASFKKTQLSNFSSH